MKKAINLKFILTLSSFMLLGCSMNGGSNELKGNIDDYYKVNFYTDYETFDYDDVSTWDINKATYLGYCYVLKGSNDKASLIDVNKVDDKPIDYKTSKLNPVEGKAWKFKGFVAYDGQNKIDLNKAIINDNYNAFAHFESEWNTYNLKILDNGNSLYNENLEYGYKIKFDNNNITILNRDGDTFFPKENEKPLSFKNNDDTYYQNYPLLGFTISYKDNEDKEIKEEATNKVYLIDKDYKIEAKYQENPNYEYFDVKIDKAVEVKYQASNSKVETLNIPSSFFLNQRNIEKEDSTHWVYKVRYGKGLELSKNSSSVDIDYLVSNSGVKFKFTGFKTQNYDDSTHLNGQLIDVNKIKDNCSLTPIFNDEPFQVTFYYYDSAGNLVSTIKKILYNGKVTPVDVDRISVVDSNLVFTGDWYGNSSFEGEPFDFSTPISNDIALWPKYIEKDISFTENEATYSLTFDEELKGYSLNDLLTNKANVDMSSLDYFKNSRYGFFKIDGFNKNGSTSYKNISSIKLPDTIKKINNNSFLSFGSKEFTVLDLRNIQNELEIGNHAFRAISRLKEIYLPRIKSLGQSIFAECDSLEKVYLSNTEEECKDFNFNLPSSTTIIYA